MYIHAEISISIYYILYMYISILISISISIYLSIYLSIDRPIDHLSPSMKHWDLQHQTDAKFSQTFGRGNPKTKRTWCQSLRHEAPPKKGKWWLQMPTINICTQVCRDDTYNQWIIVNSTVVTPHKGDVFYIIRYHSQSPKITGWIPHPFPREKGMENHPLPRETQSTDTNFGGFPSSIPTS